MATGTMGKRSLEHAVDCSLEVQRISVPCAKSLAAWVAGDLQVRGANGGILRQGTTFLGGFDFDKY